MGIQERQNLPSITQKRLCTALLVLILAFIWGNSLLPAELSASISGALAKLLGLASSNGGAGGGDGLLRKLAHLTEFMALGGCLVWRFSLKPRTLNKTIAPAAACGILAACADEAIQCFVPGRGPGLRDVGIDSLGVLLGICLLIAGKHICKLINTKHLEENKT